MSEYHGLKFHGQKEQEQIADLRSRLAAAEAERATWQQRATSAERLVAVVRGEVAALRRALVGALIPLEALNIAVTWELAESVKAEIADAVSKGREALNATSQSAQLGALIAAALEETRLERAIAAEQAKPGITTTGIELVRAVVHAKGVRRDAAEAVLAREVRT